MKKMTVIAHCLFNRIKKKFFKDENADYPVECENLFSFNEDEPAIEELIKENEYLDNYRLTTRWQTV